MNREIEFMAWDEKKKSFRNAVVGKQDNFMIGDSIDWEVVPKSEYKIYQYTGLRDKNGDKIFEGALLRNPPKDQWEEDNYVVFEVFFHDNDHADNHIGWQLNRLHFKGYISGYNRVEKFLPKYVSKMICIGHIALTPLF